MGFLFSVFFVWLRVFFCVPFFFFFLFSAKIFVCLAVGCVFLFF